MKAILGLAAVVFGCGGISDRGDAAPDADAGVEPECALETYTVPLDRGAVVVSGAVLSADGDPDGCRSVATCYEADGSGVARVWQGVGWPDGFRLSWDGRGCP